MEKISMMFFLLLVVVSFLFIASIVSPRWGTFGRIRSRKIALPLYLVLAIAFIVGGVRTDPNGQAIPQEPKGTSAGEADKQLNEAAESDDVTAAETLLAGGADIDHQEANGEMALEPYRDPKGYFEIVPPTGWSLQEYPDDPRGKVAFLGPRKGIELRILVSGVEFDDIDGAVKVAKEMEKNIGINMNIKRITYNGRPAMSRSLENQGVQFFAVDILTDKVTHNLSYSAPPKFFQEFRLIAEASMATYKPLRMVISDADARKHLLAKARRLWELKQDQVAVDILDEWLAENPRDQEFRTLKGNILRLRSQ